RSVNPEAHADGPVLAGAGRPWPGRMQSDLETAAGVDLGKLVSGLEEQREPQRLGVELNRVVEVGYIDCGHSAGNHGSSFASCATVVVIHASDNALFRTDLAVGSVHHDPRLTVGDVERLPGHRTIVDECGHVLHDFIALAGRQIVHVGEAG